GTNPPGLLSSNTTGDEFGPQILLPDGRVFAAGAVSGGKTAVYNPATGVWSAGPNIPGGRIADDSPGAVLPNGHVLFVVDGPTPTFNPPSKLCEFDPVANTIPDVTATLPP